MSATSTEAASIYMALREQNARLAVSEGDCGYCGLRHQGICPRIEEIESRLMKNSYPVFRGSHLGYLVYGQNELWIPITAMRLEAGMIWFSGKLPGPLPAYDLTDLIVLCPDESIFLACPGVEFVHREVLAMETMHMDQPVAITGQTAAPGTADRGVRMPTT
jgi:hypothetical protein